MVGENCKLTRLLQSCRCPAQRSNERDLSEALECRRRNSNNLPITWFCGRNRVIYQSVLTTKPLEDRDLEECAHKTCSCPSYGTIFWDVILGWYYNILGWKFIMIFKKPVWTNKKFVYLIFINKHCNIIPK